MSYSGLKYSIYKLLPYNLQNYIVTRTGNVQWKHENSEQFQNLVNSLNRIQYRDSQFIDHFQTNRLIAVLHAAKSTEFYSAFLLFNQLTSRDPFLVLNSVLVHSKDIVRSDFKRFLSPSFSGMVIQHGTSWTTGTPLKVLYTKQSIDME